jgi:hypothetical protein
MYIIVERNYPSLCVRPFNCEIRVVIYTFLRLLGNEKEGINVSFDFHKDESKFRPYESNR